jgi:hypothetical protein
MRCVKCFKQFDKFLAISNSAKNDLIKYLNLDEKAIDVMHGAASDVYKKIAVPDEVKKTFI